MNGIEKAIEFALMAHEGALRKGTGLPYILHPLEAAAIAAQLTKDPDVIAAAILQDVLEDTSFTADDIRDRFGERVAELVISCTENKRRNVSSPDSWNLRKRETIEHLKTASCDEKIVAFADKLSNLRSMVTDYMAEGESFWDRFNVRDPRRHVWYYTEMICSFEEFGDTIAYREYLRLVRMLRMRVQEYEDFGRHDANSIEVIATPNSGYWVLRTKQSDNVLLMPDEELRKFIGE